MKTQTNMWGYWKKEYYEYEDALVAMYPHMLKNPRIKQALASIKNAKAAIDAVMAEETDKENMEDLIG